MWYFAYGSNMSLTRMAQRGVVINQYKPAKLKNFELKFNKISKTQGAVANIVPNEGSIVEGVLYEIEDIAVMDKFESFPKHYKRTLVEIDGISAWVYIAQPEYIVEGLKPNQEYLNYLLEAKDFLSEEYYQKLKSIL
ncbi:MAG: gamma-glutamylcyclotransferase [Ignavibacteria bacterium]|nr:gamma-glutamylcyclotransferase [Ignavibacteria bacterium]